ncbi:hypothetical protein L1987_17819 [Smallanthus sonchifolius]|uniref:Uncharacterized protein n=1 Tax=Smallanthus sonchifolius TaxID=185202 RepID=A0ACB9IZJ3_9ASTR|nr:hypothetical protein L1987_17819 [Smallanthus sonchifolius]
MRFVVKEPLPLLQHIPGALFHRASSVDAPHRSMFAVTTPQPPGRFPMPHEMLMSPPHEHTQDDASLLPYEWGQICGDRRKDIYLSFSKPTGRSISGQNLCRLYLRQITCRVNHKAADRRVNKLQPNYIPRTHRLHYCIGGGW